jgi:hypothetical protein
MLVRDVRDPLPVQYLASRSSAKGFGERELIFDQHKISDLFRMHPLREAYAKPSLKKYRPIAARNEDKKVFSGLL